MPANYVLLERIELNASAASVTFSNIPQTGYTDLKLVYSVRNDRTPAPVDNLLIGFNGVYTSITDKNLYGSGSAAASSSVNPTGGYANTAGTTANTFSNGEIYIPNYTSSNYKSWSGDGVTENNATEAYSVLIAGLWSQTAAITSISLKTDISPNLLSGSTFSLYGLAAVGTTPAIAPKASGGNQVLQYGSYWYHLFTASGTFTPQTSLSCEVLSVGGGGGGGTSCGGGGGGGELDIYSTVLTTATGYAITIGAGGAGSSSDSTKGTSGNTSSFSSLVTSLGGGGGGAVTAGLRDGLAGGSGGGASGRGSGGSGGTASGSNTFTGGAADGTSSRAGGGGGATGAGASGATGVGTGGAGYTLTSADSNLTSSNFPALTGMTVISSGGGGGNASSGSSGGTGAGAGGAANTAGGNATSYGSGGGGGGGTTFGAGGNGYQGIVIIRYTMA